eukprot:CAMPEP_0174258306 /NCGR_PEP_ID=MMETSP0439-20130205/7317_1 /TAXON_ID=0 /ORGANISM="Stereomyxa ramosa, Strain Chinc5" /LENGTH=764 /DNA_ID=CAMNT_0015341761 /DNA_START=62 /DNA_END=2356 /DNA_ORIENTATION=-
MTDMSQGKDHEFKFLNAMLAQLAKKKEENKQNMTLEEHKRIKEKVETKLREVHAQEFERVLRNLKADKKKTKEGVAQFLGSVMPEWRHFFDKPSKRIQLLVHRTGSSSSIPDESSFLSQKERISLWNECLGLNRWVSFITKLMSLFPTNEEREEEAIIREFCYYSVFGSFEVISDDLECVGSYDNQDEAIVTAKREAMRKHNDQMISALSFFEEHEKKILDLYHKTAKVELRKLKKQKRKRSTTVTKVMWETKIDEMYSDLATPNLSIVENGDNPTFFRALFNDHQKRYSISESELKELESNTLTVCLVANIITLLNIFQRISASPFAPPIKTGFIDRYMKCKKLRAEDTRNREDLEMKELLDIGTQTIMVIPSIYYCFYTLHKFLSFPWDLPPSSLPPSSPTLSVPGSGKNSGGSSPKISGRSHSNGDSNGHSAKDKDLNEEEELSKKAKMIENRDKYLENSIYCVSRLVRLLNDIGANILLDLQDELSHSYLAWVDNNNPDLEKPPQVENGRADMKRQMKEGDQGIKVVRSQSSDLTTEAAKTISKSTELISTRERRSVSCSEPCMPLSKSASYASPYLSRSLSYRQMANSRGGISRSLSFRSAYSLTRSNSYLVKEFRHVKSHFLHCLSTCEVSPDWRIKQDAEADDNNIILDHLRAFSQDDIFTAIISEDSSSQDSIFFEKLLKRLENGLSWCKEEYHNTKKELEKSLMMFVSSFEDNPANDKIKKMFVAILLMWWKEHEHMYSLPVKEDANYHWPIDQS